MHLTPISAQDCQLQLADLQNGTARLRHISGARFTQWGEVDVQVENGIVQLPDEFSLIRVQHRHGRHDAKPQIALLKGWGELRVPLPPATPMIPITLWCSDVMPTIWRWQPTC